MDFAAVVRSAIDRLNDGDVDGLLALCTDDAKFFIGGKTRISGDHDAAAFRKIAPELRVREGLRRDVIDVAVATDSSWADAIIHDYVNGLDYHAVLEFQFSDEKISFFWIYVHEFEAFADAWT